jgi:hypothetical protein
MARHFLDLAGAATLETESYLLAQRAVADAVDAGAMAVLHGDAGLGKTFAVEDALAVPRLPLLWVSFPSRPTPRLIPATLLESITGRATRLDRFAIIRVLVEHLTQTPSIVVVDESQLLTSDCIELLRYLHDHRTTRFALVLVGGNGTWRVLSREPMLASRVYRRVRFQPLTRADVLAAIPAYHPLYAHAHPELIRLIDDLFAHGILRNWAAFTDSALRLARDVDRDELDLGPQRLRLARWRGPLTATSRSCSIPTTTSKRSLACAGCTRGRSARSSASLRLAAAAPRWPTACSRRSVRRLSSSHHASRSGALSTYTYAPNASAT